MAELGFTTYIEPDPPTPPTLEERFGDLTGAEKIAILDGFSLKILANRMKYEINVPLDLIQGVYLAIDEIEEYCRSLMREEVLLEEATYDPETGEELTPAVYNTAPTTVAELKAAVVAESIGVIFTPTEIGVVIDRMIDYSELDEDGLPIGTDAVYAAEVVK